MSLSIKVSLFLLPACLATANLAHAGEKLLGTPAREWQLTDWLNSRPLALKGLRGKVVLVRWWTGDGCPFCAATAPALREFHSQYAARDLVVVGVYHHKGKGPHKQETVKKWVQEFGFRFPVALDPDWQTLKRWWLNDGRRKWTSAVFDVVARLRAAFMADYIVLGGGNVKKLDELPPACRMGDNSNAFLGGIRLWGKQ